MSRHLEGGPRQEVKEVPFEESVSRLGTAHEEAFDKLGEALGDEAIGGKLRDASQQIFEWGKRNKGKEGRPPASVRDAERTFYVVQKNLTEMLRTGKLKDYHDLIPWSGTRAGEYHADMDNVMGAKGPFDEFTTGRMKSVIVNHRTLQRLFGEQFGGNKIWDAWRTRVDLERKARDAARSHAAADEKEKMEWDVAEVAEGKEDWNSIRVEYKGKTFEGAIKLRKKQSTKTTPGDKKKKLEEQMRFSTTWIVDDVRGLPPELVKKGAAFKESWTANGMELPNAPMALRKPLEMVVGEIRHRENEKRRLEEESEQRAA